MNDGKDIESLKAEVVALRAEVKDLKEIIGGLYMMLVDEEEYEEGPVQAGRYVT
jgi:cell division protein FtsB